MRKGRILLLNGASSAGKTSVAQALATCLPTPWLVMPVDLFHSMRSRPPQGQLPEDEWQRVFQRTRSAYHRALAGAGLAGCDVIGDHVLSEPWRLAELIDLTTRVDVLLVHVTCARSSSSEESVIAVTGSPARRVLRPRLYSLMVIAT